LVQIFAANGAKGESKPDIQSGAFKLRIGAVEIDPARRN